MHQPTKFDIVMISNSCPVTSDWGLMDSESQSQALVLDFCDHHSHYYRSGDHRKH